MAPNSEKSQLKRPRGSLPENDLDPKRTRREERQDDSSEAEQDAPQTKKQNKQVQQQQLPTPATVADDSIELRKEETATPPGGGPSQVSHRDPEDRYSQTNAYSSPPPRHTSRFHATN
ncbi:unnamed protein product [Parascedosporium putredinis]|uniref:Uncharacterized protein n=1 Tax=Parascedosporium putredinis TaxID=1442378 RepID=A0A9P1H5X4_9PEZI|nr:unnamed protein product [Parascedosporium putredinis]CAI7998159.1 unnamed protein product [Parascedosporium putredinis]